MIYSDDRYRGYFHALEKADCNVCEIAGFRVDNRSAANIYSTLNQPKPNFALAYIQEGSYEYTHPDGSKLVCQCGDISFLPKGARYSHINLSPARMLVIYFGLMTPDGRSFRPELDSMLRLTCRDAGHIERLFRDVVDRYCALISSRSDVKAALHSLLGALAREEESNRLSDAERLRVAPALERLNAGESSRPPTVAELARLCCMSEYAFRELFKKYAGITPKAYIDERRLRQVEELKRNSDMTMTDAARACGFDDPSYFFKLYKRLRGHAPNAR